MTGMGTALPTPAAASTVSAARPFTAAPSARQPFGDHLRYWRRHRRLTQLDLAHEANVSTRHLSFVETGRASPSREMVLRLSQRLEIPLRARNALLVAAGFAPMYHARALDDPALAAAQGAVALVLEAHAPCPALAVDRHWNLVSHNRTVPLLLAGADADLLQPPVNVLRLALHPRGLAPRIANLGDWRAHLLERVRRQIGASADPALAALLQELEAYPDPDDAADKPVDAPLDSAGIVVPLKLRTEAGLLSFISTTTVFGTPVEVTLQELALETFFPADPATADVLRRWA
ncbi:MAG: Transcriptional regulator, Xre family [Burkholderiaceae bacterium]|jgi:transcriptional regulator with XRE-family HTH domain|nr:MAG: Transcriptional regulator, Xre family [Burkholderiaceae bacterium]